MLSSAMADGQAPGFIAPLARPLKRRPAGESPARMARARWRHTPEKEQSTMAWEIDTDHSHVRFAVRQAAYRPLRGRFDALRGYAHIDDENPLHSWVDLEIDAASVDTGNAERDGRLRSADFLGAAEYPVITFKSSRVEHVAGQDYTVSGELTMRGVTRQVSFDAVFDEQGGLAGGRRAPLIARTKLQSADFGLTSGAPEGSGQAAPGETTTVEIDLTLAPRLPAHPKFAQHPRQHHRRSERRAG
jgi:polyisoprenoid-binding protein YceI